MHAWRLTRVVTVLLALAWARPATAQTVTVIADGKPRAAIVLAKQPTRSAQLAALELQEHLKLASGATLPILKAGDPLPENTLPLYVGESKATRAMGLMSYPFQPQESLIKVTPKAIVLIGRDDPDTGPVTYEKSGAWPGFNLATPFYRLGTLYAVYEFLERFCGVRWYMVTDLGRVVPPRDGLALEPTELRFRPWTSLRQIGRNTWGTPGDLGEVDLYGKRRYKRWAPARELILYALRTRAGGEPYSVNHSVYGYAERFGKEHPDWFVDSNPAHNTQLRYHHPQVIEQVAKDAIAYFSLPFAKRRFGAKMIHASRVAAGDFFPVMSLDNRNYGADTKPPQQLERQGRGYGSGVSSNYIFTWVNNVARKVAEVYPGGWISTCAYAGMFEPPEFDMEPNVAVTVCMADGWRDGGYGIEMLHAWRARVSRLYTWEYFYSNRRFPRIRPHKLARYIQGHLRPLGVEGMFMEVGDTNAVMVHLDHYVTMRLLSHAEEEIDQILDEYFRLFYGPAAKPIAAFWNALEAMSAMASDATPPKSWIVAAEEGRIEQLQKQITEAERLATAEPYASRVKLLRTAGLEMIEKNTAFYRAVEAAGTAQMKVPSTACPVTIDGRPDETAWEKAAATPPFVTMLNKPQDVKTVGLVTHDAQNLYIAFRCEEPHMDKQTLNQVSASSALCTDDSIEVNIDMDTETDDYLQIMVNAKGLTWWWWRKKHRPQDLPDLGIKAAAVRDKDGWTCEIAVPFKAIAGQAPKTGSVWGLNLMRNRVVTDIGFKRFDERKWACWSPTFVWSWHIKDRFGRIVLGE